MGRHRQGHQVPVGDHRPGEGDHVVVPGQTGVPHPAGGVDRLAGVEDQEVAGLGPGPQRRRLDRGHLPVEDDRAVEVADQDSGSGVLGAAQLGIHRIILRRGEVVQLRSAPRVPIRWGGAAGRGGREDRPGRTASRCHERHVTVTGTGGTLVENLIQYSTGPVTFLRDPPARVCPQNGP
ncbi:hypothetical protein SDC9_185956 [bioreactor metagenome]|uniref:Uncharacterized protein n=1 Tax=bioreactor metagenome TaxID=1076179 RepID=A0A645HJ48_9ZZZZ